jgi:hypothetical protein
MIVFKIVVVQNDLPLSVRFSICDLEPDQGPAQITVSGGEFFVVSIQLRQFGFGPFFGHSGSRNIDFISVLGGIGQNRHDVIQNLGVSAAERQVVSLSPLLVTHRANLQESQK